MGVKTYNPKKVTVIVGGAIMGGFSDGGLVTVARNEQAMTLQMGTDGEAARSKTNNKAGLITISLLQTSPSNAILQGFASADELSDSGVFSVLIKDNSGSSLYAAETAWVQKVPDSEFAREAGARDWILETDNLEVFIGGN